mmetsp:Transcript_28175/g.52614  ORF Transcript_28175/g.52614 Transcript_28175/m.52614 type:complete len:774 (-) Transcript_28175:206-2527(-)
MKSLSSGLAPDAPLSVNCMNLGHNDDDDDDDGSPAFGRILFRQTFLRNITRGNTKAGDANDANANLVYAGFPAFRLDRSSEEEEVLNALTYGGIHMQNTALIRWGDPKFSARADTGYPLVLFNRNLTTAVLSPFSSFFVGIHSTGANNQFECGIKQSVQHIPGKFTYDTVLVSGQGINSTVNFYGEMMMQKGGKTRVSPYVSDFVLSHLGYWTDNGAYYYHYLPRPPFNNSEEALKAVQADAIARDIPVRYFQWDDWWFYNGSPWQYEAVPSIFPDGLSDWMHSPLSLYTGEYGANNPYRSRFEFVDHQATTVLPVDVGFYRELFRNGTKAGMKMFEQDYLSSINGGTNLTSLDLDSGDRFFGAMNEAALEANITLQLCMMHPCHALATSAMQAVTNARASPDHVRVYEHREEMIGWNSLLLASLGVWSSRDNVWTNSSETRSNVNNETDVITNTILALLAGGPYGPGDGAGSMNRSLIMRTCRDDGLMLRADFPSVPLDKTFAVGFDAVKPVHVWATSSWLPSSSESQSQSESESESQSRSESESQSQSLPYTYVVALNLDDPFEISLGDLQSSAGSSPTGRFIAREVMANGTLFPLTSERLRPVDEGHSAQLPACPVIDPLTAGSVFWTFAPVLANDWAYLGEVDKIVSASSRRVRMVHTLNATGATGVGAAAGVVQVTLVGSPGEATTVAFAPPPVFAELLAEADAAAATVGGEGNKKELAEVAEGDSSMSLVRVDVSFPESCAYTEDNFGNKDCTAVVSCNAAACAQLA